MKKDGHTHSHYCPHGSFENVRLLIDRAIEKGIEEYSITEHAPLPKEFENKSPRYGKRIYETVMAESDLEDYLQELADVKKEYEGKIKINIGLEFDYLDGLEEATRELLDAIGPRLDDSVLSIHWFNIGDEFIGVDFSPNDYEENAIAYFGSFEKAQNAYLETLLRSVKADLGKYKPKRIGHMTLSRKYRMRYPHEQTEFTQYQLGLIDEIFEAMKEGGYEIDYNHKGLRVEDCRETYPPKEIAMKAKAMGIPLVFGSDSHGVDEIQECVEL